MKQRIKNKQKYFLLSYKPKYNFAIDKYIRTPEISQILVINGALAVAGSNFNRVKINGNNIPTVLPTITMRTIVNETTGIISGARQEAIIETPIPIVIPKSNHTAISLPNRYSQSLTRTSPFPRARITNVAACDPALPPLSISKGRKNTKETIDSITLSKREIA